MGKWCVQASLFIFDRIFIKLAGNQDRHKISDEFEIRPDWISHLGVTCPWRRFKFSIDLWNLQSCATPLTVFHRLFWNFSDVFCMEWRCACALDIILWLFFSHFFCFVNLVFFQYEMLSKCIGSGYLVGATPLIVFLQLFWNFADVFGMEWRCACSLSITLIIFSHFFCYVNLVSYLTWNAIEMYR